MGGIQPKLNVKKETKMWGRVEFCVRLYIEKLRIYTHLFLQLWLINQVIYKYLLSVEIPIWLMLFQLYLFQLQDQVLCPVCQPYIYFASMNDPPKGTGFHYVF